MAGMPNLNTLIASGDSGLVGNVPTFGTSLQVCRLDGTNLCGNPGQCLGSDPPLKSCGSTSNPMDPGSFYPLKPSLTLWLVTGCAGFFLLVILCMCYFCGKRGAVAARQLAIAAAAKAPKQPADDAYHRNPPSETEMTLITLSRTGLPPRIDSLPDRRRTLSPSGGGTADRNHHDPVAARTPFLLANAPRGSETFPVRRGHAKTRPDELALAKDDAVLLLRVFADGWAEGVSRRAGGPAVFPLACLGGGVPVVLAERVRSAGDGFAGAPTWPPAVSEQEVVVSRGTVPVPMEEGRQEGSSSSVLPLLGSGKKGVGQMFEVLKIVRNCSSWWCHHIDSEFGPLSQKIGMLSPKTEALQGAIFNTCLYALVDFYFSHDLADPVGSSASFGITAACILSGCSSSFWEMSLAKVAVMAIFWNSWIQSTIYLIPIAISLVLALDYIAIQDRDRRKHYLKEKLAELQLEELQSERHRTDHLLSLVLPPSIVARLREVGTSNFDSLSHWLESATVMFMDVKNLKDISNCLKSTEDELILLNSLFHRIDDVLKAFPGIERTIHSKILFLGGHKSDDHTKDMVNLALTIKEALSKGSTLEISEDQSEREDVPLKFAFGIHIGPLITGVVGKRIFCFEIYGDTVNTASRMLSAAKVNQILLSAAAWRAVSSRSFVEHFAASSSAIGANNSES
ncbi:hypothetical protein DFJ73DRAFT_757600 [Zopfochytrium polystomum]|nr:hypothetical protein DFJ73DRAFT_757600 [Zopfochytrium polystomum]